MECNEGSMGPFRRNLKRERITVALAGCPNVGKSSIFNGLTGMKQHTGNWPGKTVEVSRGMVKGEEFDFELVDLPGTYSLGFESTDEEIARDFILSDEAEILMVVLDATSLERNLQLALQIGSIGKKTLVIVNLMDEAKINHITVQLENLSLYLGCPVIGTVARKKKSLKKIVTELEKLAHSPMKNKNDETENIKQPYGITERDYQKLIFSNKEEAENLLIRIENTVNKEEYAVLKKLVKEEEIRKRKEKLVRQAEEIYRKTVVTNHQMKRKKEKIDRFLTGKYSGFIMMGLLWSVVFYITIVGANYPSSWLSSLFFHLGRHIKNGLYHLCLYEGAISFLMDGVYRVLTTVISVMLPPMAIFFPMFTLLEDVGYLPRMAYNLDKPFHACSACGKQALCMSMGIGCNAAGVVGARIIRSERERLLAILTNSFMPCNGRFPFIITITGFAFFAMQTDYNGVYGALVLTFLMIVAVSMTFLSTKLLSKTLLKGKGETFILELPPYRKPQIGKVLIRSLVDRTIKVLGRAVLVAAPAGAILWILGNISIQDTTILTMISDSLDPLGQMLGMDGVILLAFLLGFPANEIVLPIILMGYTAGNTLTEIENVNKIFQILTDHGWTLKTVICTLLFAVFHAPCSTTVLTIKKETKSIKWTVLSIIIPTIIGVLLCMFVNIIFLLFK